MRNNRTKIQNNLMGKVALITGSASGIGASTARRLAQSGVLLALLDQDENRLRTFAEEIVQKGGQKPLISVARVEQSNEINYAVTQVFERYGRIDILVNCAGTSTHIPFLSLDENTWDYVVDINLKGTFACCRAVATIMVNQCEGTIVNISSVVAFRGAKNLAHYSAAKAGVLALTKSMALELAPYGIRVNAIAPGAVDTPLFRRHRNDSQIQNIADAVPLGRVGQPDDIAAAIHFLISSESSYITGQIIHVNGGSLMF